MALYLEASPGDRIIIGGNIIKIEEKSGRRIRVRIDTTADVKHERAGKSPDGDGSTNVKLVRPSRRPP